MLPPIEDYFFTLPEPEQSCLLFLRRYILSYSKNISEARKFNTPFYYYKGKWLCFISYNHKDASIYISFVKGHLMNHPKLVSEGRKQMKIIHINAHKDIDTKSLGAILKQAVKLY